MELPNFISLIKIAVYNASSVFFIIDWYRCIDFYKIMNEKLFDNCNKHVQLIVWKEE